ncbi:hypothetical protein [Paenibacillus harenae]|uniref:Uncharacterized protein n=1 Tax=Paenibacillus harenae TaxID=306543 RepID=A0ABT9TYZ3_PAEHA|nr:hypothetical protein [Paenibacillus harenae]MDQ0112588.1 hypothetical protein [Paenibacillus harenae]
MKRVIAGGFILLSGIILYLGMHISASIFIPNINGWSTPPGRFGTALRESGGYMANIFAIILCILGFFIIIYECYLKEIIDRNRKTIAQRNMEYKNDYEANKQ